MSTVAVPLLRFVLTKAHMKAGATVGFSTSLTYMLEAIAPQLVDIIWVLLSLSNSWIITVTCLCGP